MFNYFVKDTSLRQYADDTTAYTSDASPLVLEYLINSDLEIRATWLQQDYLLVNVVRSRPWPLVIHCIVMTFILIIPISKQQIV